MKRFVFLSLISSVLLVIAVVTVSPTKAYPAEVKPVKIGGLLPLSGAYGVGGTHGKQGIEFAIDEINKAGGIKSLGGAKIEIAFADDKTLAATSLSEFERLVISQKVSVVIGPISAPAIKAIFPYADRYKVPVISMGVPILTEAYSYGRNMLVLPSDLFEREVKSALALMQEFNLSIDKVAVIGYDVSSGPVHKRLIPDIMEKFGMSSKKIVMNELFSGKADDLRPLALKAKATGAQMVFAGMGGEHMILWAKACYGVDYFPLIFSTWGALTLDETWKGLGDGLARVTLGRPGWIGTAYFHPDMPYKPLQDYIKRFKNWAKQKGLPEQVEQYHVFGGQAAYFVCRALEMAGSREPTKINKAMWDLTLKKGDPHFVSPIFLPELKFDPKTNYPVHQSLMAGFWDDKGKVQIAYPKEMRTAPTRNPVVR